MKKTVIITLLAIATLPVVTAQTTQDALRYSRIYYSGTARFNGLGGAFGALGADFSTFATNPAGIGLYTGSEATFTIAPNIGNSESSYNGTAGSENRVNFAIGNIGVVFNIKPYGKHKTGVIRRFNFGFGLNRQNDFGSRVHIRGINMQNSMMQSYANTMNERAIPPTAVEDTDPFDLGLAYTTNLVFYDADTKKYYSDAAFGGVVQDKTITTYGGINELDIAFGANIKDRLFLGLTFGVPFVNYYESSFYSETDAKDTIPNFITMNYQYDLHTWGTGFNVKFGMIYKPAGWFRIGASVHSPTWYPNMKDTWYSSMESYFDTVAWNTYAESPVGNFNYGLTTPFRAMGSLAFIIGQYGLVSADYEYVNYSQARFHSSEENYDPLNNEIKSSYQSWGNIRVGTEWRISNFRVRGGFGYFSNPYKTDINNAERYQVSGGLGYRAKHFFADVTYTWSRMNQDYYLYDPAIVNPAKITYYTNAVSTTVGFRF